MTGAGGGKSAAEMAAAAQAWADAQLMTVTCGRCGWRHIGLAADARAAFRTHLSSVHPDVRARRRVRSGLKGAAVVRPRGERGDSEAFAELREQRPLQDEARQLAAIDRGRTRRRQEGDAA